MFKIFKVSKKQNKIKYLNKKYIYRTRMANLARLGRLEII